MSSKAVNNNDMCEKKNSHSYIKIASHHLLNGGGGDEGNESAGSTSW